MFSGYESWFISQELTACSSLPAFHPINQGIVKTLYKVSFQPYIIVKPCLPTFINIFGIETSANMDQTFVSTVLSTSGLGQLPPRRKGDPPHKSPGINKREPKRGVMRAACDACTKNKTRCAVEPDGVCRSCKHKGFRCVFSVSRRGQRTRRNNSPASSGGSPQGTNTAQYIYTPPPPTHPWASVLASPSFPPPWNVLNPQLGISANWLYPVGNGGLLGGVPGAGLRGVPGAALGGVPTAGLGGAPGTGLGGVPRADFRAVSTYGEPDAAPGGELHFVLGGESNTVSRTEWDVIPKAATDEDLDYLANLLSTDG